MAKVVDAAFRIGPAADIDPGMRLAAPWQQPASPDFQLGLEARGTVQPASFDTVRATVARDFNEERRNTANREIFEKLRGQYQIAVDEAALAKAAAPAKKLTQR